MLTVVYNRHSSVGIEAVSCFSISPLLYSYIDTQIFSLQSTDITTYILCIEMSILVYQETAATDVVLKTIFLNIASFHLTINITTMEPLIMNSPNNEKPLIMK